MAFGRLGSGVGLVLFLELCEILYSYLLRIVKRLILQGDTAVCMHNLSLLLVLRQL